MRMRYISRVDRLSIWDSILHWCRYKEWTRELTVLRLCSEYKIPEGWRDTGFIAETDPKPFRVEL